MASIAASQAHEAAAEGGTVDKKSTAVSSDSNRGPKPHGHTSWEKGKTLLAQEEIDRVFIYS